MKRTRSYGRAFSEASDRSSEGGICSWGAGHRVWCRLTHFHLMKYSDAIDEAGLDVADKLARIATRSALAARGHVVTVLAQRPCTQRERMPCWAARDLGCEHNLDRKFAEVADHICR